jgi:hypothetical protein
MVDFILLQIHLQVVVEVLDRLVILMVSPEVEMARQTL